MAFRNREEYEGWKAGRETSRGARPPAGVPAEPVPPPTVVLEPGDIELRMSVLYAVLTLFLAVVFLVIGLIPFGKGGPTFRTLSLVIGAAAIPVGLLLYVKRPIVARLTSRALHLKNVVIPWTEIDRLERTYMRRNYWIDIHLKTRRTDLDAIALKARAALRAMGREADFDYSILETDLPKSGLWFIEECRRRMGQGAQK
jgi:hypothetical protein